MGVIYEHITSTDIHVSGPAILLYPTKKINLLVKSHFKRLSVTRSIATRSTLMRTTSLGTRPSHVEEDPLHVRVWF